MAEKRPVIPQIKTHLTKMLKDITHHERTFQKLRKEKITDLNRFKPGDHVSFYKTDFYYAHHGIVCEARTNYLRVIHYFNTLQHAKAAFMKGSIYIAAIIESEWPVNVKSTSEDIYLHHYDNIQCFSNEETLRRAFSQLGKRGYSLLGNNCEHWARWCRTGEHYSEQVYKFHGLLKEKYSALLIVDPTALLVKDIAMVGVQTFGQFLSAAGSGVILTTVETISAMIDITRKKNEYKKGTLSDVALKKYVIRRVTSASTTVVGGTAGTVVGTILIPVPILGATAGGVIGSISGKLVGGVSGIAISKIVEVHDKMKASKIKKMSTIPKLMNNLSPESELVRGLRAMTVDYDNQRDEDISKLIEEAMDSKSLSLYPVLEDITRQNQNITIDKCQAATRLTDDFFADSNEFEYFVLSPVPDQNAPEEFESSADLLVLRWPEGMLRPWESDGEHVLNIDDLRVNTE